MRLKRQRQSGLSLVELLVTLAIGVAILGFAIQTLIGNMRSSSFGGEMSYIQENARFAMAMIGDDIRQAGYFGCAGESTDFYNVVEGTTWAFFNGAGVQGYEQGAGDFPADIGTQWTTAATSTPASVLVSDMLVIRRADDTVELIVESHSAVSSEFTLTQPNTMDDGDLFVAVDSNCRSVGIAEATDTSGSTLTHDTSGNNCDGGLKSDPLDSADCGVGASPLATPVDLTDLAGDASAYSPGSTINRYRVSGYYVGQSAVDATIPALYRATLTSTGGVLGVANEELVTGVEEMQILFGVDTEDTDPDGIPDRFLTGTEIATELAGSAEEFIADAGSNWVGWDRVVSVRLQLVFRSMTPVLEIARVNHQPITGGTVYNDNFMRQAVSVTFQVRNGGR